MQKYLKREGIQEHSGVHNLKSSWVLCANLYFAHHADRELLGKFLAERIDARIVSIERLELEYEEKYPLDPTTLLGEPKGKRGANHTSPDVAFIVMLEGGGLGLILTECKFTEHSFYRCSGRNAKYGNPAPERCLVARAVIDDPATHCHLLDWKTNTRANRRYWEISQSQSVWTTDTAVLSGPPTAGYQLFRQQALAEAIAETSNKYDLVVNSVAYDARNKRLIGSLRSTGINSFATEWGGLFSGKAKFASFTHQDWVQWVRDQDSGARWNDWLGWVTERYGY